MRCLPRCIVRLPRLSLVSGVLALLSVASSAQLPVPAATKQLREGLNAKLKEHTATLKSARKQALADIKAFQQGLADGTLVTADVEALADDIDAFLQTLDDTLLVGLFAPTQVCPTILASVAGLGSLDGKFPKDFNQGVGGAVDGYLLDLSDRVAGARRAIGDRLRKLPSIVEQSTSFALTVVWNDCDALGTVSIYSEAGGTGKFDHRANLDFVLGFGSPDVDHDGVLFVGGTGLDFFDEDEVSVFVLGLSDSEFAEVPVSNSSRWLARFDNEGAGFSEGLYEIDVRQDPGLPDDSSFAISLR